MQNHVDDAATHRERKNTTKSPVDVTGGTLFSKN